MLAWFVCTRARFEAEYEETSVLSNFKLKAFFLTVLDWSDDDGAAADDDDDHMMAILGGTRNSGGMMAVFQRKNYTGKKSQNTS
jgi:hypothetical protein